MFWPLVPQTLDVRVAASGLALINSLGSLAGLFAPTLLGYIEDGTGSTDIALYVFAVASVVGIACLPGLRRQASPTPDIDDLPAATATG